MNLLAALSYRRARGKRKRSKRQGAKIQSVKEQILEATNQSLFHLSRADIKSIGRIPFKRPFAADAEKDIMLVLGERTKMPKWKAGNQECLDPEPAKG